MEEAYASYPEKHSVWAFCLHGANRIPGTDDYSETGLFVTNIEAIARWALGRWAVSHKNQRRGMEATHLKLPTCTRLLKHRG